MWGWWERVAPPPRRAVTSSTSSLGFDNVSEGAAAQAPVPSAGVRPSDGYLGKKEVTMGHVLLRHKTIRARTFDDDGELVNIDRMREKAKEHLMETACTIYNEESKAYEWRSVFRTTPTQLGIYGVGIQLYFELLFAVGLLFVAMFVLSLPTLITCMRGSLVHDLRQTADASSAYKIVALFSIANIGSCTSCVNDVAIRHRTVTASSTMRVEQMTPWLGTLDGLALLLLILFGIWFRSWWIPRGEARQDEAHVTAADYAVHVVFLPRRLPNDEHRDYENELRTHFVEMLRNLGVDEEEAIIEEVALVREYDGAISEFMQQGLLLEQRHNAQVGRRLKNEDEDPKGAAAYEKQLKKAEARLVQIEEALQDQASKEDQERDVCSAFVMFRREAHKELVLNQYHTARSFLFRLFQRPSLRFHGKRIKVVQACEPTDLFWENLDFHYIKRQWRTWSTRAASWIMIIICVWLLMFFKSVERELDTSITPHNVWLLRPPPSAGDAKCWRVCGWQLSESLTCEGPENSVVAEGVVSDWAMPWGGAENSSVRPLPSNSSCWESPGCGGNSTLSAVANWTAVRLAEPRAVRCMQLQHPLGDLPAALELFACDVEPEWNSTANGTWDPKEQCIRMRDLHPEVSNKRLRVAMDGECFQEVPFVAAKKAWDTGADRIESARIRCYCSRQAKKLGLAFSTSPYDTPEKRVCEEWSRNELKKIAFLLLGVVVVLILNNLMLLVFTYLDSLARYETATDLSKSQFMNLFSTQLVNTALVTLLVSMNFRSSTWDWLGHGPYDDFSASWFVVVGTSLFGTTIGQAVSTTLFPVIWGLAVNPLYFHIFEKGLVIQSALNDVYTLPDWTLSLRLAESMTVIFCVVMYGGGMPLLYVVGILYCGLAYWVDKLTLLRWSRQPPAFDARGVALAMHIFPAAALAHALVTMLILGHQDMFPSRWGPFLSFGETLLGIPLDWYNQVMDMYDSAGSEIRDQLFKDYIKARGLDCTRDSCSLLFLLFLLLCIHYLSQPLLAIFRPCRQSATFAGREWLRRLNQRLAEMSIFKARQTKDVFSEAKLKAAKVKLVFSYKLSENPRYKEACAALAFDPDATMREAVEKPKKGSSHFMEGLEQRVEKFAVDVEQAEALVLDRAEEALRHGVASFLSAKEALAVKVRGSRSTVVAVGEESGEEGEEEGRPPPHVARI